MLIPSKADKQKRDKMKLIGSTTSPYVRRTRLLLALYDMPCDFIDLNIYAEDRDALRRETPALKIPVLQDEEQVIFDSRVISRYLSVKLGLEPLDWERENQLTLIDAVNDSLVTLLLSIRSGIDVNAGQMFYNLQHERVDKSLTALNEMVQQGEFDHWDYPAICLLTMADWALFREMLDTEKFPALCQWVANQQSQPGVSETDPRRA